MSKRAAWGPEQGQDEDDFIPASVDKHTQITRLSDQIFSVDLASELCVGSGMIYLQISNATFSSQLNPG